MSNPSLLMVENNLPFSAVGVLHYRFYSDRASIKNELLNNEDIQAIIGKNEIPFGRSQFPELGNYADNVDTMRFFCGL